MTGLVISFAQLSAGAPAQAGGKGSTLARLFQAGYPVPDGCVVMPAAFDGDLPRPEAVAQLRQELSRLRASDRHAAFAVRSSALAEDSFSDSFAGEFESVLDVIEDSAVLSAIREVRRSRLSERVRVYAAARGVSPAAGGTGNDLAVVVQRMAPAEFSGVLFTADPVSGSYLHMTGNAIRGLGDRLVAGETNAQQFTLKRTRLLWLPGNFDGPAELWPFARRLYKLGLDLEKELGGAQDIEWAFGDGQLHLLQARPITTLRGCDPDTGYWNDSLRGDFLWTNVNAAEARPDVMTPLTWTLGEMLRQENQPLPGNYPFVGNIGGRVYLNLSLTLAMFRAIGLPAGWMVKRMESFLGPVPEGMDVPIFPLPAAALFGIVPEMRRLRAKEKAAPGKIPAFLRTNRTWCREMRARIAGAGEMGELLSLWHEEIMPYWTESAFLVTGGTRPYITQSRKAEKKLKKLVGEADMGALLSNLSSDNELLASLGPVVGAWRVATGTMAAEDFLDEYGHRSSHEMELYYPRPYEDGEWFTDVLAEYAAAPVGVEALLTRQHEAHEAAWRKLAGQHPRQAKKLQRQFQDLAAAARLREAVRSEAVRIYGVIREVALRAGALSGLGDDVFFLMIAEFLALLQGEAPVIDSIPMRRATYERLCALPPYPTIIRGRFDPFAWASDPERRGDVFNAHAPLPAATGEVIKGFPGAAGRVEGLVRRLDHPEQGDALQLGEILVTVTTNVGWTTIFPRAAAVVTDVGAPLSHAAIVARELGIPAVVGCMNATTLLRTGDRIRVDGARGIVERLDSKIALHGRQPC
jgi:pyruvate,water dikinase